ncbi:olfactory receptor 5AP2-like [Phyllobates terribilis]|uniref:olfactory receptor 5AP2-like n=1 Tax=Phyllobates terribilis TaxID=111132 RepID=UPI003CCB54AF
MQIKINQTRVSEFILLGITDHRQMQVILFVLLLLIYMFCMVGNLGIICLIKHYVPLHTPMYYFLSHFSFLEMCYTSVTAPKLLFSLETENREISFAKCMTQMYFFSSFAATDCFLLAGMAYDRYIAICSPLRYLIIMSNKICRLLTGICWTSGFWYAAIHTSVMLTLPFCGPNKINHFFCDFPAMLKLVCGSTLLSQLLIFIVGGFMGFSCFFLILVSYVYIISTILKIRSSSGRHKAFSTCSSHLAIVTLYYGTLIFTYLRPTSSYSLNYDGVVALFYCLVNPMLNLIIYTLRNKEVRTGIKKLLQPKNISLSRDDRILSHAIPIGKLRTILYTKPKASRKSFTPRQQRISYFKSPDLIRMPFFISNNCFN